MLRASKYSRKEKDRSTKIQTRQQKDTAKTEGDIRGWFGIVAKVPRGRPKKGAPGSDASIVTASTSTNHDTTKRSGAAANCISGQPEPKRIRGDEGGTYTKWNSSDEHFAVLKAAVINTIKPDALVMVDCRVSRATAGRYIPRFNAAANENDVAVQEVTRDMIFQNIKGTTSSSLLSKSDWKFISDIAISRDMRNNGMTRAEMITMIVELSEGASFQQAKNHYDYLVRSGHLKGLKKGGRVVTCQKTTTKRSQITMEQQLRWHASVDFALSEQVRLNLPADEFEQVKEHFFCNMDESCLLGSDGTVKVIGSASKSKTEKIMGDCRSSITVLRTGAAGGSSGPWIFLAAGKVLTCRALRNIDKKDGVPPNSKVYMTPTAYMTDNVYAIIAPELADGIRKMPYICDHPDWWVVVSLDGFGSHVNVHEAQEAFFTRKILILKEEGDTSHLNQAYDQSVAKNDKAGMRANLDMLRPHIGTQLDQWYLITIAIDALKRVKATAWIESFTKVNLHPRSRMPFHLWLKKIDGKLGHREFFANRTSLFDAMPAVWKNLSVEDRHAVVRLIDGFYTSSKFDNVPIWTKSNVLELVKYAPLGDIGKLRSSYLATKIDPSVFVYDDKNLLTSDEATTLNANSTQHGELPTSEPANQDTYQQPTIDNVCSWKPQAILEKYIASRHSVRRQKVFLNHITNFVAYTEASSDGHLLPSAYLDIVVTTDQMALLKPTCKDVVMGCILRDTLGPTAKKLIAKRRIDVLDGNIGSYSRLLNSSARLEQIKQVNALAAAVAEISNDKENSRKEKKDKLAEQALKKAEKKKASECGEEARRLEVMAYLAPLIVKFETGERPVSSLPALPVKTLKEILKYYFNAKVTGLATMKKMDMVDEVAKRLVVVYAEQQGEFLASVNV